MSQDDEGRMTATRDERKRVLARFRELYAARRKALPPTLIDGLVLSILAGELRVMVDEAEFPPLHDILPILREARQCLNG